VIALSLLTAMMIVAGHALVMACAGPSSPIWLKAFLRAFKSVLKLKGVGYRAQIQGTTLNMSLGYSHPVVFDPPEGIQFAVESNTKVIVTGIDKEIVGNVAASIRAARPPEPYKGKGVRYEGEQVRRKAGKAGKK
jgi:large subunit ribosomal protein L6